jgi:MFS family permease
MIFAGLTADGLSRRLGRAAIFWGGGGGMTLGGMLIALGHQVWMTLTGALVMGSFGTLLLVGIQAALADRHGERQGIALAEANIGASLGAGLSALCVAGFAFLGVNWRGTLVVPVMALSALTIVGRREALGHQSQNTGGGEALSALQLSTKPLSMLFWIAWLVVVCVVSIEWCMTFWGASFLQSKLHLDGGSAATLLALYLLSTVAGRIIGSRLTRIVTGPQLLLLALGVTLLGFSFFWFAPVVLLTVGGLLVTGMGVSNLWPQAIAYAFATSPQQSDRVSAKVSLGAGFAISVAPLLLGTLANRTGLNIAYGIVPCFVITALVMTGFTRNWRPIQTGVKRGKEAS